jgi:hypothetical protein
MDRIVRIKRESITALMLHRFFFILLILSILFDFGVNSMATFSL